MMVLATAENALWDDRQIHVVKNNKHTENNSFHIVGQSNRVGQT